MRLIRDLDKDRIPIGEVMCAGIPFRDYASSDNDMRLVTAEAEKRKRRWPVVAQSFGRPPDRRSSDTSCSRRRPVRRKSLLWLVARVGDFSCQGEAESIPLSFL
jgi:hypothetical protein